MSLSASGIDLIHRVKRLVFPTAELRKLPVVGGLIGRLRQRRLATPVSIGEFQFYAGDEDTLGLLANRDYCPEEQKLYRSVIQAGDNCVELGSNIGLFTVLYGQLAGERGHVLAFEPSPANASLLRRNLVLNRITNVEVIEKAVSDQSGTGDLHLSRTNCGDNRIYESDLDSRGTVTIETIGLDEFFATRPGGIDFLKMDIQGAEAKALAGMKALLRDRRVAKILMEFWPHGLVRSGADPASVLERLRESGFSLFEATTEGRVKPVTDADLLQRLPPSSQEFANVYATLSPPPQALLAE